MMRYIFIYVTALLLFSSCRDASDEQSTPDNSGVTFYEQQSSTRANEIGSFVSGDAVGIFAVDRSSGATLKGVGNFADNKKYVYDADKVSFIAADLSNTIFNPLSLDLDYYVYYPYMSQIVDATKISYSLTGTSKTDDFLLAKVTSSDNSIGLSFSHLLAKVIVKLDADKSTATGVSLSTYPDANISLATGAVSTIVNARSDISLDKTTDATIYYGVALPQTYKAGEKVVTVLGSTNSSYAFAKDREVFAGKENNLEFMGKTLVYDFTASPSTISASATANSYTLSITSQQDDAINGVKLPGTTVALPYSLTNKPDWITVSGTTVAVDENTAASVRTGTLTFKQSSSNKELSVTVNQDAGVISTDYVFSFDNGTTSATWTNIASTGSNKSYTIISTQQSVINGVTSAQTNAAYSASSSVSWITVSGSTITVDENTTTVSRGGVVTFTQSGSGKTIKVTITQAKKNEIVID
ncbi:MAG: hypothetical protein H6Q13_3042 [Bacteroidetes bacterium]|nr:hypothetical protein [Bacteroidota bacterium]